MMGMKLNMITIRVSLVLIGLFIQSGVGISAQTGSMAQSGDNLAVHQNDAMPFWKMLDRTHPQSLLPLASLELGGQTFEVELATTSQAQAKGLMNRYILPLNQGMLFIFDDVQMRTFWMKNTKIPLDIMFFDENGHFINVESAVPCLADPCRVYPSEKPAKYVLELQAGSAEKFGLKSGMAFKKVDQ